VKHDPAAPARDASPALSRVERKETVESIASVQLASGCIPWCPGEHVDPWNHVESAMALTLGGLWREAEHAYAWLAERQRPDGEWASYYHADGERVKDPNVDTNLCAYVAVGVWQHWRETGDAAFLRRMWPVVDAAVDYVLALQSETGAIWWARNARGEPWEEALLTGSSSIHMSLRAALAVAAQVGEDRPRWRACLARLRRALLARPEAFGSRERWAMDWYYPILGGAVRGPEAGRRLGERWELFVVEGRGVRCVHDRNWVTAAETCELVLTLCAIGERAQARQLFDWVQFLRADDGAYWEGWVWPEDVLWPDRKSTWTAAAAVLAAEALDRPESATSVVFRGGFPL
jgi:hypothetical protein